MLIVVFLQLTLPLDAQLTGIRETGAIAGPVATVVGVSPETREWRNTITNISEKEIVAIHVTFLCTLVDGQIDRDELGICLTQVHTSGSVLVCGRLSA